MKRKMVGLIIVFIMFIFANISVEAKVLPRFNTGKAASTSSRVVALGVGISPRLRADRKALNVYFSGLSRANTVSYTLIYTTNGKDEGVGGSIDSASGDAATRELFFGTCSSGVCRNHTNITNMRLEVISELTNGRKTLKRFRIKV